MLKLQARFDELCAVLFVLLVGYALFSLQLSFLIDDTSVGSSRQPAKVRSERLIIQPFGPLFHPNFQKTHPLEMGNAAINADTKQQFTPSTQHNSHVRRVLVIAAAPRSVKHIVSLWSSLECFTSDADHVAISAPTWSQRILERIIEEAVHKIPRFATGKTSLEAMVAVNDRYDAGLWCDALSMMGVKGSGEDKDNNVDNNEDLLPYDEIALLNDSSSVVSPP